MALLQVCSTSGCSTSIPFGTTWCDKHRAAGLARKAEAERKRHKHSTVSPEKQQASRLYGTAAWQRIRAAQLRVEPLCRHCTARTRITAATIVDHIQPHWNDRSVFYDQTNLQSLCKSCHDAKTAGEDAAKRKARNLNGSV
jgi:5-methylcytosine-specific restriction protein A